KDLDRCLTCKMASLILPLSSRAAVAVPLFLAVLVKGRAPVGVAVGPGGHGQGIHLHQLVVVRAVHALLNEAQQGGGNEGHGQVADHLDGGGGEVHVVHAHDVAVEGEELGEADDEHHGRILDVDDEVVADLGDDVADGLGQNHRGHGLEVVHADGPGALSLAGVNGDDTATHRL